MKKFVVCTLLGALALPVFAQAPEKTESVTITDPDASVRIVVPGKNYLISSDEFYHFKGSYSLSNGQVLSLFDRGPFMYARLMGEKWHRIIATAPNAFVALDKQMKMRIDLNENGDASGELYIATPMLGQVPTDGKDVQLQRIAFR
jgi:hypothetical protein